MCRFTCIAVTVAFLLSCNSTRDPTGRQEDPPDASSRDTGGGSDGASDADSDSHRDAAVDASADATVDATTVDAGSSDTGSPNDIGRPQDAAPDTTTPTDSGADLATDSGGDSSEPDDADTGSEPDQGQGPPVGACPHWLPELPLGDAVFEQVAGLPGLHGLMGAGDLDGDGRAEVFYVYDGEWWHGPWDPVQDRVVHFDDGWEPVLEAEWTRFAAGPHAFGDADGDGLLEVIGLGEGPFVHHYEQPTPGAPPTEHYESPEVAELAFQGGIGDWHIADMAQDGRPEILLDYPLRIFESTGDDAFDPDPVYAPPMADEQGHFKPHYSGLNVGDFDGDGRIEVGYALARSFGDLRARDTLRIVEPDAAGQYIQLWEAPLAVNNDHLAADGDADGDGRPELLRGGYNTAGPGGPYCWWFGVFKADGDNSYSLRWQGPPFFHGGLGDGGTAMAAMGDTDGDGDDEVLLLTAGRVDVFELSPAGQYERIAAIEPAASVAAADLDGDGADEVVVGNWLEGDPELQETVKIYKRVMGQQ